jgi:integrase
MSELHHDKRQPVVKATVKAIEALKHTDKAFYKYFADGLAVRVMPVSSRKRANKTLYFVYRDTAGKKKHYQLGHFNNDIEKHQVGDITLAKAFEEVRKLIGRVNSGDYPHVSDPAPPEQHLNALAEETASVKISLTTATVDELVVAYLQHTSNPAYRAVNTHKGMKYNLEKIFLPAFRGRLAKDIKKSDAYNFIQRVFQGKRAGKKSPGMAREVIKACSAMYCWQIFNEDENFSNPFSRIKVIEEVKQIMGSQTKDPRALEDDEIVHVWRTLNDTNGPGSAAVARALLLTLVTGQRPGEVAGMHRREILSYEQVHKHTDAIKPDGAWWKIPWERIKTEKRSLGKKDKKDHLVYLSPLALKIIGDYDDYIFPSPRIDSRPITEHSMSKLISKECRHRDKKSKSVIITRSKYLGLKQWDPNSLRKTVRTNLSPLKCPPDIAERIINHSLGKMDQIYNLYGYAVEKQEWLGKWSDKIGALLATSAPAPGIASDSIRQTDEKYDVEELKHLVATMTLTAVAKKLGITDNAVKKRCQKHGIPLPPQGYWLKSENRDYPGSPK